MKQILTILPWIALSLILSFGFIAFLSSFIVVSGVVVGKEDGDKLECKIMIQDENGRMGVRKVTQLEFNSYKLGDKYPH